MIPQLAQEMYEKSVKLKKYDERELFFITKRRVLLKELQQLSDMTDALLSSLQNNPNYSYNYTDLAVFMKNTLSECIIYLTSRDKNYRTIVKRYTWGFHNLPRAFLSISDRMKITPDEAEKYFKSYIKF